MIYNFRKKAGSPIRMNTIDSLEMYHYNNSCFNCSLLFKKPTEEKKIDDLWVNQMRDNLLKSNDFKIVG
ncbi:MAG: hypothetical protein LIO96_03415 [Lachnospiraceae bacterium]|nr:hypothetical protein [Lachnospiraceae bacterium]